MAYYILFYKTVDNFIERRQPYRSLHLSYVADAFARGEILLAGAFSNPGDEAALIFKVRDEHVVNDFAEKDPYVVNGLIKEWSVRAWNVVIGNEAN